LPSAILLLSVRMALLSLIFISTLSTAYAVSGLGAGLGQSSSRTAPEELVGAQRTVRAEPAKPVAGTDSHSMYQIEIGHKGVLSGNLEDMAALSASSEHSDDVVTLSGHPRSVHDGLQVLRIQQDEPPKQGSGCAVVGLGLVLASLVGIAMKLNENQDPYNDLRGSTKPLAWVAMTVQSSVDALDENLPAKITTQAQETWAALGHMAAKALRKTHASLRRMARPNLAKCDFGEGHEDVSRGVQFVTLSSAVVKNNNPSEGDLAQLSMPEEPKPSELAGMTMEALALQLEKAGQDELAAQMLANNSKCLGTLAMDKSQSQEEGESEAVI